MPLLTKIQLADFRNIEKGEFLFTGQTVIFTGRNGSGKSNMLEAISMLSILRSFRGSQWKEMIRCGTAGFSVSAEMDTGIREKIALIQHHDRRELFINGGRILKSSDFIREFRTVAFSPEDINITGGSACFRRRFFDILISAVDLRYFNMLSEYTRAVKQRNCALKSNSPAALDIFENVMADYAPEICRRRIKAAAEVTDYIKDMIPPDWGKFDIRYSGPAEKSKDEIIKLLENSRTRDALRGHTSYGPHQDDFDFCLDGRILRSFGSNGQKRLIALFSRIAEFKLVKSGSGQRTAVLIDDVTCELDRRNRRLFFENISSADQCFYTFTEFPDEELNGAQQIDLSVYQS